MINYNSYFLRSSEKGYFHQIPRQYFPNHAHFFHDEINHFNPKEKFNYPLDYEYLKSSHRQLIRPVNSYSVACESSCGMARENIDLRRVKRDTTVRIIAFVIFSKSIYCFNDNM